MSACVNTLIIISKTLIYALYLIAFNYKYDAKVDRMEVVLGLAMRLFVRDVKGNTTITN